VNDDIGHYFQSKKGLRHRDPLSPITFNLVADMLAILIERAKDIGNFSGVIPHLVDNGLSILQYADDTILFMEYDINQAKHLKLFLSTFEQLSGLKIKFYKSELFCYGEAKNQEDEYAHLFGCKSGVTPFKYLVFLCIIRNCLIVIDLLLKRGFKKSFVVGKESSFLLEDG
jgi:hypothetical protein